MKSVSEPLSTLIEALYEDIVERTKVLKEMRNLYTLAEAEWDEVLSEAEFAKAFGEQSAAAEYRNAVYELTDKLQDIDWENMPTRPPSDRASVQRLVQSEAEYKEFRATAFAAFKPTIRSSDVAQLRAAADDLRKADTETALVLAYRDLDRRLISLEELFLSARSMLEGSIQHAIDIERGK